MALIKATKGAKRAVFSELAWASGQPQRYGWHSEEDEPKKKLPAEILEFATIRKKFKPDPKIITSEEKQDFATGGIITGKQIIELEGGERVIPIKKEIELVAVKPKPKAKSKVKPKAEKKTAPKKKK